MRKLLQSIDAERPILLAGPTASGKSSLAMEIAARRGGVIVNADALQVFSCWRVLTARPSAEDERAAEHRLYGHVHGGEAYSVGAWLREVEPLLTGRRPIIVGGTGLYLTRLTKGLAAIPRVPQHVRDEAAQHDPGRLLTEIDASTAARIDAANPARVRRAWEVQRATGRGLASWQDDTPPALLPLARAQAFVVDIDREALNARIARRADQILAGGAVEEVRRAVGSLPSDAPAMKAIGAHEIADHLAGRVTLEAAGQSIVIATRRYAKRQRTWLRGNMDAWTPIAMT